MFLMIIANFDKRIILYSTSYWRKNLA